MNESNQPKSIARSTVIIIIFSLVGKLMGFGREMLVAALFGAGMEKDAFVASQSATSTVSMFIVMGISTVFIPQLQAVFSERGEEGKLKFTNNMFWVVTLLTGLLTFLGIEFAWVLGNIVGPRFDPATKALTIRLIQIGMPVIIFAAYEGIFTGYLNFHNRFAVAASVPIWLNTVYLLYLYVLRGNAGIYGLSVIAVLACAAEALVVLIGSMRIGFRFKPYINVKDPYMQNTLRLAIPSIITVSINNINTLINRALASGLPQGSMSRLDYANKLNVLIIGIFVTAITTVIYPAMAQAFDTGNMDRGKKIMNGSIRAVLLVTIPSMVGLIVLALPIVKLAFEYGAFTRADTIATARCLQFYTLALISVSVNNVQNRVFYSLGDTKTPFYLGIVNVAFNVGFNLLLIHSMGINGLAFSVSIATTVVAVVSFYLIRKKIGHIGMKSYIKLFIKTGIASLVMGLFAYFFYHSLGPRIIGTEPRTVIHLAYFLVDVLLSVILYGVVLYHLGLTEARQLKEIIGNFFSKRRRRTEN